MYKAVSIYLLILYILPILAISITGGHFTSGLCVLLIIGGFFLASFIPIRKTTYFHSCNREFKSINFLMSVSAYIYFIINAELIGQAITNVMTSNFIGWAQSLSDARYSGELEVSVFQQLSTIVFIFYTALFGANNITKKTLFILILMICVESLNLSRASVVLGLGAFFTEYIIRMNAKIKTIDIKTISIRIAKVVAILFFVFLFSSYMRVSHVDNLFDVLIEKFNGYTFAMYDALLMWIESDFNSEYEYFGYSTFTFVFKTIGYTVPQGFYEPYDTYYGTTNVFTVVRGLISDFGILGALIFFLLSGICVRYYTINEMGFFAYYFIRLLIYIILMLIISPFSFTTVTVGFLAAGLINKKYC